MNFQITEYCHHILEEYIEEGDICIDATAGNGGDTEFCARKSERPEMSMLLMCKRWRLLTPENASKKRTCRQEPS